MNTREIKELFERIKRHYTVFTFDDDKIQEWRRFLKDYNVNEINDKLDEYLSFGYDNPPLVYSLTKGLSKNEEKEGSVWITCCDICKEKIAIYNDDMEDYEKHFRRCSKIDFIDRMSKKFRGKGVALAKYYEMNDVNLDNAYNKIMTFYRENKNNNGNILKEMPSDELY